MDKADNHFKIPRYRRHKANSLRGIADQFLDFKGITRTQATRHNYKCVIDDYIKWATAKNKTSVSVQAIYSYFVDAKRSGLGNGALHSRRQALNSFFDWCLKCGHIDVNPVASIPANAFTVEKAERVVLLEDEYRKIKHSAQGTEFYFAIVLAWHTAMRLSDVCLLKWESVDLSAGVVTFLPLKSKKTGKRASVPIAAELKGILNNRLMVREEGEVYVSPALAALYKRDKGNLSRQFGEIFKKAGVNKTFHAIRHATLERWMNHASADVVTVMAMSGHNCVESLAGYVNPSMDKRRAIIGE